MPTTAPRPRTLSERVLGSWTRSLDHRTLRADALAGLLGALLVLPQAFAFATLAGLPPQMGLAAAIVPCAVAALFGSSRHVVSGPTNAISLALVATLAPIAVAGSRSYVDLALAVTVLVGAMQLGIALLRLGGIAHFISPSTLRGFTTGASVLIVVHALTDLLGLATPARHGIVPLLEHLASGLDRAAWTAVLVALASILVTLAVRRWRPAWPSYLIGLVAATLLGVALDRFASGWPGWRAVSTVGPIPSPWPVLHVPQVDPRLLPDLLAIAFAITIVALGQSISIAKAVADRSGQSIDANREFRGQGLANLVGGFVSAYVACGSLNRSMPNYEAGARTPLAAVFAAGLLLVLAVASAPLLAFIPLAGIAGLLILTAWSLIDIGGWRRLWRASRYDVGVAAATAVATVAIRLEIAILLGTLLSLVGYLHRTSRPAMRTMGFDAGDAGAERPFAVLSDTPSPLPECPQLKMLRMEGEVYFGAVPWVDEQLRAVRALPHAPKHLLVMAKSMNFIDVPAAELWRGEMAARRAAGGDLWFHRPREPVLQLWRRLGFSEELGPGHVFPTKRAAIGAIFGHLDRTLCAHCTARVFQECGTLPPPVEPMGLVPQALLEPPLRR